jgi:hypothetical protein
MKKILDENQRQALQRLADRSALGPSVWQALDLVNSILTSVDAAEKRLAELEPKDLRTEEVTLKVTYDNNVVKTAEVVEELKKAMQSLPFSVDAISLVVAPSPGEGFRYVNVGEVLNKDDQFRSSDGEWFGLLQCGYLTHSLGCPDHQRYRRKL